MLPDDHPHESAPCSPCINVCRLNAAGDLCTGCCRTLDEIIAWGAADDAEKHAILQRVAARRNDASKDSAA